MDLPVRIITEFDTGSFTRYVQEIQTALNQLRSGAAVPMAAGGPGAASVERDFRALQASAEATTQQLAQAGANPALVSAVRTMFERIFKEALHDINPQLVRPIKPLEAGGPVTRRLEDAAEQALSRQQRAEERAATAAAHAAARASAGGGGDEFGDPEELSPADRNRLKAAHALRLAGDADYTKSTAELSAAVNQLKAEEARAAQTLPGYTDSVAKAATNENRLQAAINEAQRLWPGYADSVAEVTASNNRLKAEIAKAERTWPGYAESVAAVTREQNLLRARVAQENRKTENLGPAVNAQLEEQRLALATKINVLANTTDADVRAQAQLVEEQNILKARVAEASRLLPGFAESVAESTRQQNLLKARIAEENQAPRRVAAAANAQLEQQRLAALTKADVLAGTTEEDIKLQAANVAKERLLSEQRRLEAAQILLADESGEIELLAQRKATDAAVNALIKERVVVEQKKINEERAAAGLTAINFGGGGGGRGGGGGGGLFGVGGFGNLGAMVAQGAIFGAGFGLVQQIRSSVREALELDRQLALIREHAVAIGQGAGFGELRDQILEVSRATGVAATEVATLANEFLGLYGNTAQAAAATDAAAKLILVIGANARTAGPQIAALAEDFNVSVREVGNAVLQLQDETGRAGSDMLNALGQIAPVAAELNLTLDQTARILQSVAVGSAKSGQAIGEGLARVLPELQKNLPAIERLGVAVSPQAAAGDAAAAYRDLLTSIQGVTQAQKELIIAQLGGPRNAQILAAAFRDPARALAEFNKQLDDGDRLNTRAAAAQATLKGALDRLHQSFVGLGEALAQSGAIGALTELINLLTTLTKAVSNLPALLLAAALAFKAFQVAVAGAAAAGAAGGAAGAAAATEGGGFLAGGAAAALANPYVAVGIVLTGAALAGEAKYKQFIGERRAKLLDEYLKLDDARLRAMLENPEFLDTSVGAQITRSGGVDSAINLFRTKIQHKEPEGPFQKNTEIIKSALAQHRYNSIKDQLTALLAANLFSEEDNKKISEDLAKGDPKAIDDIFKRFTPVAESALGKQAIAAAQVAKDRASAINQAVASTTDTIETLDEAKAAFEQGDLSFDQLMRAYDAEIDLLTKYTDPDSQKKRNKDLLDKAKAYSTEVARVVQEQVDARTAAGTLSDQGLVDLYSQALQHPEQLVTPHVMGPASAEELNKLATLTPQQVAELKKQQAAAIAKQHTDTLQANAALLRAQAGDDPLRQALAEQTSAQLALQDAAKLGTKDPAYIEAQARKQTADRSVVNAQNEIAKAKIALLQAQDANDPLKAAQDGVKAAQLAIAQAHGDAAKLNAQAQKIQADRTLAQAITENNNAALEILKATQAAHGDAAAAAQTGVQELINQRDALLAQGLAETSTPVRNINAQIITEQANANKQLVQQNIQQIQNDLALKRKTVGETVAALRTQEALAKQLALGSDFIDQIEIQIQNLLHHSSQTSTLNVPGSIPLPTLYEVRRATTAGSAAGYQDNRVITFAHGAIQINNGMDQATAVQMITNVIGAPVRTLATTTRRVP